MSGASSGSRLINASLRCLLSERPLTARRLSRQSPRLLSTPRPREQARHPVPAALSPHALPSRGQVASRVTEALDARDGRANLTIRRAETVRAGDENTRHLKRCRTVVLGEAAVVHYVQRRRSVSMELERRATDLIGAHDERMFT